MTGAQRLLAIGFALLVFAFANQAQAQQSVACRQLGPVAGSPLPQAGGGTDIAIVVGDHYWSCPCGQPRRLVGDSERRALVGDNEQRNIVGDS